MVDVADLSAANALSMELPTINLAIDIIDDGGRITSMVISDNTGMGPNVSTGYMNAPNSMYDAIRRFLLDRADAIEDELRRIGITGVNGDRR